MGKQAEDFIKEARQKLDDLKYQGWDLRKIMGGVLILAVLGWLASGIYIVGPGEQGVVRQFGKLVGVAGPGLNYRLPVPLQDHDVVDMATVRRVEIGFRDVEETGNTRRVPEESLMLTGDENIVEVQLIVQYVVKDPADFLFKVKNPEETLHAAAEVALRGVVGQNTIDHTMTEGRVEVQEEVQEYLQRLLDDYRTGILTTDVKLLEVDPPDEVYEAFHEVVRAWEDRERKVEEARAYQEDIIPRARGQAIEILKAAAGYQERRVLEAEGDAAKFEMILAEYTQAREVTRERLYLEMLEKVLPNLKKYIMDGAGTDSILPLLPLGEDVKLDRGRNE